MTDLHTHILPGMDDGAHTLEEALQLLREQKKQGITKVALTPHFYKRREATAHFLARRLDAWEKLQVATRGGDYPELILGAEVAWAPDMSQWPELEELCYQNTKILLVELPVMPWTDSIFRELYNLEGCRGVIPMIAHLDRYYYQQKKRDIDHILEMGYPVQVSAEALSSFFFRKHALNLLENYDGILISDCHNLTSRTPNMAAAVRMVEKKRGTQMANQIKIMTEEVLKG